MKAMFGKSHVRVPLKVFYVLGIVIRLFSLRISTVLIGLLFVLYTQYICTVLEYSPFRSTLQMTTVVMVKNHPAL
jgi:hypothetical protein